MSENLPEPTEVFLDFIDDLSVRLLNDSDRDLHRSFLFEFYFRLLTVWWSGVSEHKIDTALCIAQIFYTSTRYDVWEYVEKLRGGINPFSSISDGRDTDVDMVISNLADIVANYALDNGHTFDDLIYHALENTRLTPKLGFHILETMGYERRKA